ncbi:ground-like domain protein, partial [Ostertagia ostertagi]
PAAPRQRAPLDLERQLEKSGASTEFNFGPLNLPAPTLSKQLNEREKHSLSQSASALRNNFSGKKHSGGRISHSGQSHAGTPNRKVQNFSGRNANLRIPPIVTPPGGHLASRQRTEDFGFDTDDEDASQGSVLSGNKHFRDTPIHTPIGGFAAGPHVKAHTSYVYPEKNYPLRACFYNPSGYACCNRTLNDEIVQTFEHLVAEPGFNLCNTQKIANALQTNCARRFKLQFEAIVGLADYAQRVNFARDLVCKVELAGRYMLVYATPIPTDRVKREDSAVVVDEHTMKPVDGSASTAGSTTTPISLTSRI